MFDRFIEHFHLDGPQGDTAEPWHDPRLEAVTGHRELAARYAGRSFNNGLYRVHDASTGPQGQRWIGDAFPEFAQQVCPFAYDWLGRQFAVDYARTEAGEPLVLMLDPGAGEALEIPVPLRRFHDEELVDYADAALAVTFFQQWATAHTEALPLMADVCVGYRVPLFLGGADNVTNVEVVDISVYWSLCAQLRQAVQGQPAGTTIVGVDLPQE